MCRGRPRYEPYRHRVKGGDADVIGKGQHLASHWIERATGGPDAEEDEDRDRAHDREAADARVNGANDSADTVCHDVSTPNGPGFSRAASDAMMSQLGGQEASGPRRCNPKSGRTITSAFLVTHRRAVLAKGQAFGSWPRSVRITAG